MFQRTEYQTIKVQGRESPHRRRRRPQGRGILADKAGDVILEQVFYIIFAIFPKTRPEKCIFATKTRPEKCINMIKTRPEKC